MPHFIIDCSESFWELTNPDELIEKASYCNATMIESGDAPG